MERNKKKESGGFYIAICCCVVIIAIVGYANRMSLKEEKEAENITKTAENTIIPIPANTPEAAREKQVEKTEEPAPAEKAKEPEPVSKAVKTEEKIEFSAPVKGKVIEEYSGDDLVYNEALKDWRNHSGVDFAAEIGEQVICSANGIVEDVFDSNLGRCVVVDHQNGFKTMYANLNENTQVKAGEEVAQGDVIGTVGNTALGDSTDVPHLHFEVMNKDKNIDPTEYLE